MFTILAFAKDILIFLQPFCFVLQPSFGREPLCAVPSGAAVLQSGTLTLQNFPKFQKSCWGDLQRFWIIQF